MYELNLSLIMYYIVISEFKINMKKSSNR